MEKIYDELAELFEVDSVKDADVLEEFECWDSLTILSIIALASESYDKVLMAKDITDTNTISNLIALITK